jgi:hypothetical protein
MMLTGKVVRFDEVRGYGTGRRRRDRSGGPHGLRDPDPAGRTRIVAGRAVAAAGPATVPVAAGAAECDQRGGQAADSASCALAAAAGPLVVLRPRVLSFAAVMPGSSASARNRASR